MRLLTTKFMSYAIAQFEKQFNIEFMDFLDIGNLSISKILRLIMMGNYRGKNNPFSEEDAGQKLDNYLEDHSIIDAYLQLLDELNRDTHVLDVSGFTVDDLRKQFKDKMTDSVNSISTDENKITEFPTPKVETQAPIVTPKVDINGEVPVI